jgi:hypothetical protein
LTLAVGFYSYFPCHFDCKYLLELWMPRWIKMRTLFHSNV